MYPIESGVTHASNALRTNQRARTFLLVDDHPVISFALRHIVSSQPGWEVVEHAQTPDEAKAILNRRPIDAVILDLVFPGQCGLDFLAWALHAYPRVATIVYSVQPEDIYAQRCLNAGARGYVSKKASVEVFIETARLAISGRCAISGRPIDEFVVGFVRDDRGSSGIELLSLRELEVLHLIGQGMNNGRIARELCRSTKTIESHRYRISRKLNIPNGPELMHFAMQHRLAAEMIAASGRPPTGETDETTARSINP